MAGISPTVSPRAVSVTTTSSSLPPKQTSPSSPFSLLAPATAVLEICVDSLESCIAAHKGGAHRLELCSGLTDGGVTPSYGLIGAALSSVPLPIHVLIRPRPGDFLYTAGDLSVMKADIMACKLLGASGVVIGCLTPDGRVDRDTLRELMLAAKGMTVTFHRAIDMVRADCLEDDLELLIEEGVERVLTAGLANGVAAGLQTIRRMRDAAAGRIVIMPGGGVTEQNIASVLTATLCTEVHASARSFAWGAMRYRREGVYMGGEKFNAGLEVEYGRRVSDEQRVREMARLAAEVVAGLKAHRASAAVGLSNGSVKGKDESAAARERKKAG